MAKVLKPAAEVKNPATVPAPAAVSTPANAPAPEQTKKPIDELLKGAPDTATLADKRQLLMDAGYTQDESVEAVPKSNDEILAELIEAEREARHKFNEAADNETGEVTPEQVDQLSVVAWKARDAVKKFRKQLADEKAQAELKIELDKHVSIIDELLASYDKNNAILNDLKNVPVGERKPEQIEKSNAANAHFNDLKNKLVEELKKSFGKTKTIVFAPQGMTGKQLERATGNGEGGEKKLDMYIRLLDSGMTKEQIMSQYPESVDDKGGPNGTLRTAITARNKRDAK